jgi:hypothetical protein
MQPAEATLVLNGRQQGLALTPEQQARYEAATAAVAARVAGADQTDLVLPVPETLEAHVSALRSHPLAAPYFAEGWEVRLVDLTRVCAFQPQVNVEAAVERVESVDVEDLDSIAHATLPLSVASPVSPGFDPTKNAFMVVSPNPNLRVTGVFSAQLDPNRPDILGVGFSVQVMTSFVSVASVNGRYYLRDGYHRSLGLIRRGVRYAPVFVRDDMPLKDLVPAGMLPFEVFAGVRPPTLPDFWDDDVATEASTPITQKIIIIQSTELDILI